MFLSDEVFCIEDALENPMKTVQDKHEKVKRNLKKLRNMGGLVSEVEKVKVEELTEAVTNELEEMTDIIINTARQFLSPRQVSLLDPPEETSSSDPSIQFFGLEWRQFMGRWREVGKKIFVYRKNLESNYVDIAKLVSIVELIRLTGVELKLHCWAVVTDQLMEEKLKEQLFVQRKMTYLGKFTKLGNFKPISTECHESDQIRRKSMHISQRLEILEFGAFQKPCNIPVIEQRPEKILKISMDQCIDSVKVENIDKQKPEKESSTNFLDIFSNVFSQKLGIRRISSFIPEKETGKKSPTAVRRKSNNDASKYIVNKNSVMENISLLATGACGLELSKTEEEIQNQLIN